MMTVPADPDLMRDKVLEDIICRLKTDTEVGKVKIDFPYYYAEDEIMTCLSWELYTDFKVITKSSELYRYPREHGGDFEAVFIVPDTGRTEKEIKEVLNGRLSGLDLGGGKYSSRDNVFYPNLQTIAHAVEKKGEMVEIHFFLIMPDYGRYAEVINRLYGQNLAMAPLN